MKSYRLKDFTNDDQKAILTCEQAGFSYYEVIPGVKGVKKPVLVGGHVNERTTMTHKSEGYGEDVTLVCLERED
jgi:hypothetical protein